MEENKEEIKESEKSESIETTKKRGRKKKNETTKHHNC